MATRPSSRVCRNWAYPRPRPPSRFPAGTRQLENASSLVSEQRQPTLEYSGPTMKPGVPDGTMIAEISGRPAGDREGSHDGRDRGTRVGDERLGAVDYPLVAIQLRRRAHPAGDVGA